MLLIYAGHVLKPKELRRYQLLEGGSKFSREAWARRGDKIPAL